MYQQNRDIEKLSMDKMDELFKEIMDKYRNEVPDEELPHPLIETQKNELEIDEDYNEEDKQGDSEILEEKNAKKPDDNDQSSQIKDEIENDDIENDEIENNKNIPESKNDQNDNIESKKNDEIENNENIGNIEEDKNIDNKNKSKSQSEDIEESLDDMVAEGLKEIVNGDKAKDNNVEEKNNNDSIDNSKKSHSDNELDNSKKDEKDKEKDVEESLENEEKSPSDNNAENIASEVQNKKLEDSDNEELPSQIINENIQNTYKQIAQKLNGLKITPRGLFEGDIVAGETDEGNVEVVEKDKFFKKLQSLNLPQFSKKEERCLMEVIAMSEDDKYIMLKDFLDTLEEYRNESLSDEKENSEEKYEESNGPEEKSLSKSDEELKPISDEKKDEKKELTHKINNLNKV